MAFFRCSSGGGSGGDNYVFSKTEKITFSSKAGTLSGLTSGKSYMLIIDFGWSNANYSAELASATNTSGLTKVNSGVDVVTTQTNYANTNWSIYTFTATSTSSKLTLSSMSSASCGIRVFLFEKV